MFLTAALFFGTNVVFVHPIAEATSVVKVEAIAKAATVGIKLQQAGWKGSGVIIKRQDNLYTLVTNRHVICGNNVCSEIPASEVYNLKMTDGQQYQVHKSDISLFGNDLDLAIIQFRSSRNYPIVQMAAEERPKVADQVFTSGFPSESGQFTFGSGEVIATVDKRLKGDGGGYTVVYDSPTLPGMSGGGVFNKKGELIAIHGRGEREKDAVIDDIDEIDNFSGDNKIGINRGIPVHWLIESLRNNIPVSKIKDATISSPVTADEYFVTGFTSYVKSINTNSRREKDSEDLPKAIQALTKAIQLNPRYYYSYYIRGEARRLIKDNPGSLSDFDKAININPKFARAYFLRGLLQEDFDDVNQALVDYSKAITADSKFAEAFQMRGLTALVYKPEYRVYGKKDLIRAVELFREQGKNKSARAAEKVLRAWAWLRTI
jgi:S1-C subfamily serine protease